jgi:predicted nucleic acid-binding protein
MIAPSLILAELANAVWKKWRRGEMDATQTEIAVREINRFVPEIVEMAKLIEPALGLARETGHSIYDCLYFALARQRNLDLVTSDQKLVAAFAGTSGPGRVLLMGDWLQAQ